MTSTPHPTGRSEDDVEQAADKERAVTTNVPTDDWEALEAVDGELSGTGPAVEDRSDGRRAALR